jgi:hypothetical protein
MSSTTLDRTADLDFLVDRNQWVPTYPAGRVCRTEGCGTVLSVYNSEDKCAAHGGVPRYTDPAGERVCRTCGESMPLDAFAVDTRRPLGRRRECRDCYRARQRNTYHTDAGRRERQAELQRQRRQARREAKLEAQVKTETKPKAFVEALGPNGNILRLEMK